MNYRPAILLALALLASALSYADERILQYDSRIVVDTAGTLLVTERILVRAEGIEILHGIYRDFPVAYRSSYGEREIRGFEVLDVKRDAKQESYHVEQQLDAVRVYCGRKETEVRPGIHEYIITYRTTRQIGFFKNFDELYWNVTGNDWAFPIDMATACIKLPYEARSRILSTAGYTGPKGEQGSSYAVSRGPAGEINFSTTQPLAEHEGLTIAVSWWKGIIKEPTESEKTMMFFSDNIDVFILALGILIILIYYLAVWYVAGKDPERGTIIPRYTPPEGVSPASMRFIRRMGFDTKTFAAAILTLAVKGYLKITEEDGTYILERVDPDAAELTTVESQLGLKLFAGGSVVRLNESSHQDVREGLTGLRTSLKKSYEYRYFITNRKYFIPGAILSVIILFAALLSASSAGVTLFMVVWLGIWSIGVGALLARVISSWKLVRSSGLRGMGQASKALFLTAFALPFVAGEIIGFGVLVYSATVSLVMLMAGLVFINYLFYRLLKAPTLAGRSLMDGIDGFRMYLSVAEKDELKTASLPLKSAKLYEQYLPYALALDVENEWSEKFSGVFSTLTGNGESYTPGWYFGSGMAAFGTAGFVSSFGSALAGSLSSSSGSGSGGGGSSGGGGGGGGGGGW